MSRQLLFTKISAAGNDFILIDNRKTITVQPGPSFIKRVCARRTGVGADGLILLEKSRSCAFAMRYFNADGSEAELCGNGARAIALFAHTLGVAGRKMKFESKSGVHTAELLDDKARVQMPVPQDFNGNLRLAEEFDLTSGGFLKIGVPHFVVFVDDISAVEVNKIGRALRHHAYFQNGTNVDFVQIRDRHHLLMRTYERGVEDETLACGTGAAASAITAHLKKGIQSPVQVKVPGGVLAVSFNPDFSNLILEGPCETIYTGRLRLKEDEP